MDETQLSTVRASFDHIKCPTEYDAVLKDQCIFSFDTPFSDGGLFVNLSTWQGFGEHFLAHDHGRTQQPLYLHCAYKQVPVAADAGAAAGADAEAEPEAKKTKMAIGVEGGFEVDDSARFELVKAYSIVHVVGGEVVWRAPFSAGDADAAGADSAGGPNKERRR